MSDTINPERRGPGRPTNQELQARAAAIRPSVSDSVAAALARAKEIREGTAYSREAANEFDLPLDIVPEGWSYEWKRHSVYGQIDNDNAMEMHRTGWQAVPASRHPELMPVGYVGETIQRKGLILMERPLVLTIEARERTQQEARRAVADKEASLGQTPAGTMPRDADSRTKPRVQTEFYREIPADD